MIKYKAHIPSLDESIASGIGNTPLVLASNLSKLLGNTVYLKLDSALPYSHTFKDRGAVSAVSQAKREGQKAIMCASCGNMSSAVVPLAAKAGIHTFVILSSECNLPNKVAMSTAGANIMTYKGRFDEIDEIIADFSEQHPEIPCINTTYMGFYTEGLKSLYFELFDALSPLHKEINIIVPTADGTLLTALYIAYLDYKKAYPQIAFEPHFVIAQPSLCAPLVKAFALNTDIVKWHKGKTSVLSLAVDYPKINGNNSINAVKHTHGTAVAVEESKIRDYIKLLAQNEGIFTDDVGGICIGSLYELQKNDALKDIPTVCLMTGNGLKTYRKNTKHYLNHSAKAVSELGDFLHQIL